jgi:nitrogen fixation NifU-like protein
MELESMYRETILDHYRRRPHAGLREPFDAEVHHLNPTCGDEVTLRVTLKDAGSDQILADVSYETLGCMISQASASVMADMIIGKTVGEALEISEEFLKLMHSHSGGEAEPDEDVLGEAVAFEGVSKYPTRIKCALLGWMAWKDATARAMGERAKPEPAVPDSDGEKL